MTPEAKARKLEYIREWKRKNPEKVKESNLRYRAAHRELYREARRKYYMKNRERCIEYQRAYRARIAGQIQTENEPNAANGD